MDNSYICINIDISPDIVAVANNVVIMGSVLYLAHRLIKFVESTLTPSAPKRTPRSAGHI